MSQRYAFTEEPKPDQNDLLVFVDDTGHETFAGNQGFYGLGGCVVRGGDYGRLKDKWREVRRAVRGNPNLPVHGSTLGASQPTPEALSAVSEFFLDRSFLRIAATTTKAAALPDGMDPCVPVLGDIREAVSIIVAAVPCSTVWFFFESSDRANATIQASFDQLAPMTGALAEHHIERCIMPKSSNEPGLEIADFIVSAASSQVQRHIRGQAGQSRDFAAVFFEPGSGNRYRQLSRVRLEGGYVWSEGVVFC